MLGGTDISVAEKCCWSWQMRQSPQPSKVAPVLVSLAGSEKVEAPAILFAAVTFP
jgi:hypothetical protein